MKRKRKREKYFERQKRDFIAEKDQLTALAITYPRRVHQQRTFQTGEKIINYSRLKNPIRQFLTGNGYVLYRCSVSIL